MSGIAALKAAARKAALARRRTAFEGAPPGAAGRLSEVLAGFRGVPLSGYAPINSEIDPLPAMAEAAAHGPVGLPVIEGAGLPLRFALWEPGGALVEGPFRALVPRRQAAMTPQILIVPLVAFDAGGGRLGYGGGFYDRTLAALRAAGPVLAIGFAFDAQQTDTLPAETTDEPLDMIVTESRVLPTR